MSVLTENIVLSRAKAQDLNSVRKLNCWGSGLSDVSIVRKMAFVEVLSLSVNNISTLVDFSYCPNLQELYLRKNNILNLNEVCFLKCLPHLRSLWLADNPCAEHNNYRFAVIRALPNLKQLDNIVVSSDEVTQAAIAGDFLECPHEADVCFETTASSHFLSSDASTIVPHISKQNDFGIADEQIDLHSTSIHSLLPCENSINVLTNLCSSSEIRPPPSVFNLINESKHLHSVKEKTRLTDDQQAFEARVQAMVDQSDCKNCHFYGENVCDNLLENYYLGRPALPEKHSSPITMDPDDTASTGDGYLQNLKRNCSVIETEEKFSKNELVVQNSDSQSVRKMNSNILSAVLCLVKELDFTSLQVVKAAVHCRMDEMSD